MTQRFLPGSATDLESIAEFNRTGAAFPDKTLPELIDAQARQCASRTAVLCEHDAAVGGAALDYEQLNHRVSRVASALRSAGIGRGDIVALLTERSFAMIIGILGILKAGGAYLPISTDNPPARLDYLLQDAAVKVLLVHARTCGTVAFAGRVIDLDDPRLYEGAPEDPGIISKPNDLAYVIYTSGSSGKPKGVMVEHRSVVNRLHWMQHRYPIGEGDTILQKTPYYFDVSVWELLWPALQGARLCFLAPGAESNPPAIVGAISRHQVTVMHFVPSMLGVFLEYLEAKPNAAGQELASVRRVFASGEALSPGHVRRFNDTWGSKTGARLTNLYGPTEATVDVSYFDCPVTNDFEKIPIGRPIHNTQLYVMRAGEQVAIGEEGELCIGGVGVARGYLNNPEMTARKFVDNPFIPGERMYRTGDLARWLPDGNLEYLGREDEQVKIRGVRIELGEIESTIREYPGISDCIVAVRTYSETVIVLVAYLISKQGTEVEALKRYLKDRLPAYMVPSQFERLERLPLTPSGKADRKALITHRGKP